MFLRVRGKGATPENSQATLMHIRGFRHTHCPPPTAAGSYCVLAGPSGDGADTSLLTRLAAFPHFAMGIQLPSLLTAQHEYRDRQTATPTADWEEAQTLLPLAWRELWNVYDIAYDEVPLLPEEGGGTATDAALSALAAAEAAAGAPPPLQLLPEGYILPSDQPVARRVLVCSHYLSHATWPSEAFHASPTTATAVHRCAPVVIDLSGVPLAEASTRLAVALSWAVGFASLQVDSPLPTAAAVVIRLPYAHVPCFRTLLAAAAATEDQRTYARAVLAAFDFMGEHLSLVHAAFGRTPHGEAAAPGNAQGPAPPVFFVGRADLMTLRDVVQRTLPAKDAEVPYLVSDVYAPADGVAAAASTLATVCDATVRCVEAPVKALMESGEAEWDPYVLKERTRLNFCPCCGHCGNEGDDKNH